jgi:hypothetical protein
LHDQQRDSVAQQRIAPLIMAHRDTGALEPEENVRRFAALAFLD